MVVLKRVAPVVPGSLVAVVFGILVVVLFGVDRKGVEIVGTIEGGLPSFGIPDVAVPRLPEPRAVGRRRRPGRLRGGARGGQDLRRPGTATRWTPTES